MSEIRKDCVKVIGSKLTSKKDPFYLFIYLFHIGSELQKIIRNKTKKKREKKELSFWLGNVKGRDGFGFAFQGASQYHWGFPSGFFSFIPKHPGLMCECKSECVFSPRNIPASSPAFLRLSSDPP